MFESRTLAQFALNDHVRDTRPSRVEAEAAIRMLRLWAGDDPAVIACARRRSAPRAPIKTGFPVTQLIRKSFCATPSRRRKVTTT